MSDADGPSGLVPYDEFGLLHENADDFGLPFTDPPSVRRTRVPLADGRHLSAIVWGDGPSELVLLHGGAQNAHTWDTFSLALGRPLVAIDLPGHGHSDRAATDAQGYPTTQLDAADVAVAVRALAPTARAVVGMSRGGLTSISLAATAPDLVRRLVLVDILPGIRSGSATHITDFTDGPRTFASLAEILDRAARYNPGRSLSSLRRGILHNAEQLADGTWIWRWARHPSAASRRPPRQPGEAIAADLWPALEAVTVPVLLVRGMRPDSVLSDEDERELRRRLPGAQVAHVERAGHSVQGAAPVELAALVGDLAYGARR
jgi:pimeloyl-ACP methyl ester carboxylesterase